MRELGPIDGIGFCVADNGKGLSQTKQKPVFDRVFSTADSGTSYGTAIVAAIASTNGWDGAATETSRVVPGSRSPA